MTDRTKWRTGSSTNFIGKADVKLDESVFEVYAKTEIKSMEISFKDSYYDEIEWNEIPLWSKNTGTEVWSVHLPFSREIVNIAHLNKDVRERTMKRLHGIIDCAGNVGVKNIVVHPSSEPIADNDRKFLLNCSAENLSILCGWANEYGMTLAVEDLPRTCLGNRHEEIEFLLNSVPNLMVCFDTNHLLKETNTEFIRAVGNKIATVHVSDYDFIDERHRLPGEGLIDWKELQLELEKVCYNGPFLYEINIKDRDWHDILKDIRENHLNLMKL